jgi:hypothetical protein
MPSGLGRWLSLAFAFSLLLTFVVTFPLFLHPASVVPHDPGDPLLNTWILWWNAHRLPLSAEWWNGAFFYPAPGMLTFSEHLLGLVPITTPIQWLGGGPLLAYNTALVLSFPLSALAMYLLCFFLTRRHDLAFFGGLAYAFAPYRMGRFDHLQTLSSYYMPLALLGLHAYRESRRSAWLVLFAAAWLMQGLCNGYYLVYFSVLVVLWMAWFGRERKLATRVLLAWALAAVPLVPILGGYAFWHAYYGLARPMGEVERASADLATFLLASPWSAHWRFLAGPRYPAIWLFPGLTLPVVIAWALASSRSARVEAAPPDRTSGVRLALASGAAFFALIGLSATLFGPWQARVLGLAISVKTLHKPLSVALFLLIATAMTSPRFKGALRRCTALAFYLATAVTMAVMALGPSPRCRGMLFWDKAPYWWLMQLPGVTTLRQPSRFGMLAALCLSIAAVLALERLLPARGLRRHLLIVLLAAGVLWDGWMLPLPLSAAPPRIARLEGSDLASAAVLELPLGVYEDIAAMYRSTQHGRPVLNGYSGHSPPSYGILHTALRKGEAGVLASLPGGKSLVVVIDRARESNGEWDRQLAALPATRLLGEEGHRRFYLLGVAEPPAPLSGDPLPIRTVRASRNPAAAGHLVDGDQRTYWATGQRQKPGDDIVVELGSPRRVRGIVLSLGSDYLGAPRHLLVEASPDGIHWQAAWQGETGPLVFASSLRTPQHISIDIPTGNVFGRFLRLTETRRDPLAWMMREISVLGGP